MAIICNRCLLPISRGFPLHSKGADLNKKTELEYSFQQWIRQAEPEAPAEPLYFSVSILYYLQYSHTLYTILFEYSHIYYLVFKQLLNTRTKLVLSKFARQQLAPSVGNVFYNIFMILEENHDVTS
jgi:hypothetical protein